MRAASSECALAAYEPFAEVYDLFTADHDYELWTSSIDCVARRHGFRGRRLLDVACGTGKSLMPWLERGYDVMGCDLSPAMLRRARRKVRGRARLYEADMRRLPPRGRVDLVTCLDDAANYLLTRRDLEMAFASAAARLRAGGVYVFDLNSLRAYRRDFASTRSFSSGGWRFTWMGHGDAGAPPCSLSAATITATRRGADRRSAIRSRHVQRHHPLPVVRRALAASGLRCVAAYGQHRDGSLDARFDELVHAKALVVAVKT